MEDLSQDQQNFPPMYLYGDRDDTKCISASDEILMGKSTLQDRSYCPWYNVINFDPERYVH